MSEPDVDLPESVEIAWGLRERPGKGPKRSLTLDRVVAAGIRVAAADGLAAVSMSRVAGELGVATMSLYRYVPAKTDLLDLMVDAAYGDPPAARGADEDWRPALARWAWANAATIHRHPWIRHVPIGGPPLGPNQVRWMERALAALRGSGLRGGERLSTVMLVSGYARNWATLNADLAVAAGRAGLSADEVGAHYWQQLARLTRHGPYPAIHELLTDATFDETEEFDDEWHFGLGRILDGVEALIRSRAAAT
ncbi:TetR/AcrR family transcriptional regulator [Micromonospora endolithica]|uniref:TetR/AcrR family transcriptional regulator n=1 Tax=Micromonospora endolithica TaxID=230091 RepID=A0A3A9YTJ5_9ACTN|nr:TetR/AcrR family transcriptional regulator [Micromonospora endolithica]RKN39378.1 TetR/AcrR family transcriptional regulator [Micromonospora endolithica]TWJ22695.1 TetR family transcriptional regulator [Micromonospora endolithica]